MPVVYNQLRRLTRRSDVLKMVVRYGMILAGVGIAIGLVAAAGSTRLMGNLPDRCKRN